MSIRTIRSPLAIVGAIAAPGQVIETFTGVAWPANVQPILSYVYYCGQIGDVAEIWIREALASTVDEQITIATITAGTTAANESRFCYPIPLTAALVPWVLGITRSVALAANASILWAYESSEEGSR